MQLCTSFKQIKNTLSLFDILYKTVAQKKFYFVTHSEKNMMEL